MSTEMIKVLDELCTRFGIAIDWTSENVMPYVQELMEKYVRYEITTSIFWVVFVAVCFVVCVVATCVFTPKAFKKYWNEDEPVCWIAAASIIMVIVFGVVLLFVCAEQGIDIVTCMTIPEMQMLEFLKTM